MGKTVSTKRIKLGTIGGYLMNLAEVVGKPRLAAALARLSELKKARPEELFEKKKDATGYEKLEKSAYNFKDEFIEKRGVVRVSYDPKTGEEYWETTQILDAYLEDVRKLAQKYPELMPAALGGNDE